MRFLKMLVPLSTFALLLLWPTLRIKTIQNNPPTSPHRHGPRKAIGELPARTGDNIKIFTSGNWSGYAVIGSDFTEARGSWIVPSVDCTGAPDSSASFWVGIDGWNDATVEQTGTDSDCDKLAPNYYAWIEFAPKPGVTITSVPVSPGDKMSGSVTYNGSEFTVAIMNETTGKTYTASSVVPGAQRTSAEWIAELNNCCYGLSDFGTAHFGEDFTQASGTDFATNAATSGPMSAFGNDLQASFMVSGGNPNVFEAVPSRVSTDGTSFNVIWLANGIPGR
jgi:hypothetical protein